MAEYIDIARIDDWNNLSIIDDNGNARYVYDVGELPRADVIEIPKGATNGDMIKAMFPNAKNIRVDGGYPLNYIIEGEWHRNLKEWWNAPYRLEGRK